MEYPNKIFVLEYKGKNHYKGRSHFVIVVAASSPDVAKKHVKDRVGIDVEPTWLMNGCYPTIWNQTGNVQATIQAKILYNGNFHTDL